MDHSLDATLSQLCLTYRHDLEQGTPKPLRDYLTSCNGPDYNAAFVALLETEIAFRLSRGDDVSLEIFLNRYPEQRDLVETAHGKAVASSEPTASLRSLDDTSDAQSKPSRDAVKTPRVIGGYEIVSELGRGGMGVVYKAYQPRLNRHVAVKTILSADLAYEEEVLRFSREAEAAAQLDHPNIVPVYEVGTDEQIHFFSMGFVDGETLASRHSRQPLKRDEIVEVLLGICSGLSYAHSKEIVHRDIKPGNILLDASLLPHISDFGLAKQLQRDDGLTVTGNVIGTPSYMAPEQALGKEITTSADIYAVGAVLYFLLTGRPPFTGNNVMEVLRQVRDVDPISPRKLDPTIDCDLDTICLKCLSKNPGQRYASIDAVAAELERVKTGKPIVARPIGKTERLARWFVRNPVIGGLLVIATLAVISTLAVGSFAYVATTEANAQLEQENAAKETALGELAKEQTKLRLSESRERDARLKSDRDRKIAETNVHALQVESAAKSLARGDARSAMEVLERIDSEQAGWETDYLKSVTNRPLYSWTASNPQAGISSLTYSPSGQQIAALITHENSKPAATKKREILIWDVDKEELAGRIKIKTNDEPENIVFCPNSRLLVIENGLEKIALETLPDGKKIRRLRRSVEPSTIWVLDIKSKNEIYRRKLDYQLLDIHVKENNSRGVAHILGTDGALHTIGLNDGAERANARVFPAGELSATGFATSPFQANAALAPNRQHAVIVTRAGISLYGMDGTLKWSRQQRQTAMTSDVTMFRFTPDGSRVVAIQLATGEIQVYNVSDGSVHMADKLETPSPVGFAVLADGRRVIATRMGAQTPIWSLAKGTREFDLLGLNNVSAIAPSPNGRFFAISDGPRLTIWDARKNPLFDEISRNSGVVNQFAFSDDGRFLAWAADQAAGESTVQLNIYDVLGGQIYRIDKKHRLSNHAVAFRPKTQLLASGGGMGVVRIWDPLANSEVGTFPLKKGDKDYIVREIQFDGNGNRFAVTGWRFDRRSQKTQPEYVLAVADANNRSELWRVPTDEEVMAVRFTANHKELVAVQAKIESHKSSISSDAATFGMYNGIKRGPAFSVVWYNSSTGKLNRSLDIPQAGLVRAALSPDGTLLGTVTSSGKGIDIQTELIIWDLNAKKQITTVPISINPMLPPPIEFSPDGSRVVTGSFGTEKSVFIVDVKTGARILEIADYRNTPMPAATARFSKDGKYLALGGGPQNVRVYSTKTSTAKSRKEQRDAIRFMRPLFYGNFAPLLEQEQDWFAAAFHLKNYLKYRSDPLARLRRVLALAKLGQWTEGAGELTRLQTPFKPDVAHACALVQLQAGRKRDYLLLLKREYPLIGRMTTEDRTLYAWTCCLTPEGLTELNVVPEMIRKIHSAKPNDTLASLGNASVELRTGDLDLAITELEKLTKNATRTAPHRAWLMLAIAYAEKGDTKLGKSALARAKVLYSNKQNRRIVNPSSEFDKLRNFHIMQAPLTQAPKIMQRLMMQWQAAQPAPQPPDWQYFAEIQFLSIEAETKLGLEPK